MVPERFGLGIETHDLLNGYPNRCGIYSLEVKVDGNRHSYLVVEEFAFSETRYVNSHIDYRERIASRRNIRKTFIEPNNRSRIYNTLINNGVLHIKDQDIHNVEIIVKDSYQNTSSLSFKVRVDPGYTAPQPAPAGDFLRVMPFNQENRYHMDGFEIEIPEFAFYDTIWFRLAVTPGINNSFSRLYHVHDAYTPVHSYFTIRIKPDSIPEGLESKLLLAAIDENGALTARGGALDNGYVELRTRDLGPYTVAIDTIPPSVVPINFRDNQDLSNITKMDFRLTDDFSGIADYAGFIDGEWALFEFDPKNDLLRYYLDESRIQRGQNHQLTLQVRDQKNNERVITMNFTW